MTKGHFYDANGHSVYFGVRADKPDLEAAHQFTTLRKPDVPQDADYDYMFDGASWVQTDHALADLQAKAAKRVNGEAENYRLRFITPGAGQAMTYLEKKLQAEACLADPSPDPAAYPLLAAEIGVRGATVTDVATVVKAQSDAWQTIGALIEGKRQTALVAIAAAGDKTEVDAAGTLDWSDVEAYA